jgi:probable phosphoglycerate mutase
MELILVRHGRPARMETTADPHLNEVGLEQARRAAAWLALEPIDATWSSTMRRAVQTAEAFAGLVGHEVQQHPSTAWRRSSPPTPAARWRSSAMAA